MHHTAMFQSATELCQATSWVNMHADDTHVSAQVSDMSVVEFCEALKVGYGQVSLFSGKQEEVEVLTLIGCPQERKCPLLPPFLFSSTRRCMRGQDLEHPS